MPEGPPIVCPSLDVMPPRGRIRAVGYVENIKILPASQAPAYAASVVDARRRRAAGAGRSRACG